MGDYLSINLDYLDSRPELAHKIADFLAVSLDQCDIGNLKKEVRVMGYMPKKGNVYDMLDALRVRQSITYETWYLCSVAIRGKETGSSSEAECWVRQRRDGLPALINGILDELDPSGKVVYVDFS